MRLRSKIIVLLLLFSVIPVVVVVWVQVLEESMLLERQAGESSLEYARLALRGINEYLYSKLDDVQDWGGDVRHIESAADGDAVAVSHYFDHSTGDDGDFLYALALDRSGVVYAGSDEELLGKDMSDLEQFRESLEGKTSVRDVVYDSVAGAYSLLMSAPIYDHVGENVITGVVLGALRWESVHDIVKYLNVDGRKQSELDHVMLINSDGLVISCYEEAKEFKENLVDSGLHSAKDVVDGKEGYLVEMNEHGDVAFSSYTFSRVHMDRPNLGWGLIVHRDKDVVFSSITTLKRNSVIIVVVAVLLSSVFAVAFGRNMAGGISAIAGTAEAIGRGELGERVVTDRKDEIGGLGRSINEMAEKLEKSEAMYRQLVETMTDGIIVVDVDGIVTYANNRFCEMIGRGVSETIGHNASEFVESSEHKSLKEQMEFRKDGRTDQYERVFIRKDGSRVIVLISPSPFLDVSDNFMGSFGVVTDITARKLAEEALKNSREWQKSLIENIPGMVYRGRGGRLAEIVSGSYDVCGYSADEINSKEHGWLSIIHDEDKDRIFSGESVLLLEAKSIVQSYRIIDKCGSIRWVEDRKRSIFNGDGKFEGVDGIVLDITEQKAGEEELYQSREEIKSVFESSSDCILMWDREYRYLYANQSTVDRMETTHENLIGRTIGEVIAHVPVYVQLWEERVDEVFEGGVSISVEDSFPSHDGTVYSESVLSPMRNQDGEIFAVSVIYRDVTARKRGEEALRESEEKYRSLIEAIPDVVWISSWEGVSVFLSPNIKEMYGYTPEELYANPKELWFDRIHPDDLDHLMGEYEALFAGERAFDVEYRIRRKDGEWIWLHDRSISVFEKDGKKYTSGLFTDITSQKKAADELRFSEERYKRLSESAFEGVVIHKNAQIEDVNKKFEEMFGYSYEELKGKDGLDLIAPDGRDAVAYNISHGYEGMYETVGLRKDGSEFPMDILVREMVMQEDSYRIASLRDISSRKEFEDTLVRLSERIQETDKYTYINSVGAIVAHELNQPLTIINMLLSRTIEMGQNKDDCCSAQMMENIRESLGEAKKAAVAIQKFRQHTRDASLEGVQNVEVCGVAVDIISLLWARAVRAKLEIKVEGLDELPQVNINETAFEQVFHNIIQNSIDAADGKRVHHLVIRGRSDDGRIVLEFADDCGGIEEDKLDKIYEPFYTTKIGGTGMGLGLEIVQRIMFNNGGQIRVENNKSNGATFYVEFPAGIG